MGLAAGYPRMEYCARQRSPDGHVPWRRRDGDADTVGRVWVGHGPAVLDKRRINRHIVAHTVAESFISPVQALPARFSPCRPITS